MCLGPRIEDTIARYKDNPNDQVDDRLPEKYKLLLDKYNAYCDAHLDQTREMTKEEQAEMIRSVKELVHPYGEGHRHRGGYVRGFGYSDLLDPTPRQPPVSASQLASDLARVQEELQQEWVIREQEKVHKAEKRRQRKIRMRECEDQLLAHIVDPENVPRPPPLSSNSY